jgi:hypothetical protein
MAGRPKLRSLKLRIAETGGYETLLDRIASGTSMRRLAEDYVTSPSQLAFLLKKPEWNDKFMMAKAIAAGVQVEDAFEGVKRAMPEDVNVKRLQFEAAMKLAGVFDRATFGEQKQQVQVNLSIGDLHLQALKQVGQGITIDAEVVTPAIESDNAYGEDNESDDE